MKEDVHQPPKWISGLLLQLCKDQFHEEILGDLEEFYQIWLHQYGVRKAGWMYWWHALKFLRLYSLKTGILKRSTSNLMIKHHLLVALRSLFNGGRRGSGRAAFGWVNVFGLSLAFASSLLIYLWCYQELQTDRFHEHGERIYSVYGRFINPEGIEARRNTPAKLPAELEKVIPEVSYATGFAKSFRLSLQGVTAETFQKDDIILKMKGSRASPQFFNIFSFEILQGNPENALLDPSAIAISRKMATIFFGSPEKAINQTIRYQNKEYLSVALVFEDVASNSSLQFDYLTHWDTWVDGDEFKPSWGHFGTQTYVKLRDGANPESVERKLQGFLAEYIEFEDNQSIELGLQLFHDQYLFDNFENGYPVAGKIISIRIFMGIALFILLIAVINFINLMTAKASERVKEIGLRKVIGASRKNLIYQFMTEAMVTTIISSLLGILMAWVLIPLMEALSETQLTIPFGDFQFVLLLSCVVLFTGTAAGSYPALVLSRLNFVPRKGRSKESGSRLRKGLVVFQFSLSVFLAVTTITLTAQMDFLLNKHLGFDRKNLIYIPIEGSLVSDYMLFKSEAVKIPGVLQVDRSSQTPHQMGFSGPFFDWEGKEPNNNISFTPSSVGFDFVSTMGLEIVEGRDFDRSRPNDVNNFLVNETAAKVMGGDVLERSADFFGKKGKVIGIFKDFHFNSLHQPVAPMVLDIKEGLNFGTITVQLTSDQVNSSLKQLEVLHTEINPGYAFDYTFVEQVYDDAYGSEKLVTSLVPYFAGLAIFISCLGLLGLIAFALERRIKELGVRKVLGASFSQLVHLISKDFAILMVIAVMIALPISYIVLENWLQGYAYRIGLEGWIFVVATLLTVGLSFIILFARVAKSVLANPVDSLRNE